MAEAPPENFPDIEGALRTWLRAHPLLVPEVDGRVYFSVPFNSADKFPCIMITRVGDSGQDSSDTPIDLALIQFDVYGRKSNETNGGKMSATRPMLALKAALSTIRGKVMLDEQVAVWDPSVRNTLYSALPADNRPRYVVLVAITSAVTTPTG